VIPRSRSERVRKRKEGNPILWCIVKITDKKILQPTIKQCKNLGLVGGAQCHWDTREGTWEFLDLFFCSLKGHGVYLPTPVFTGGVTRTQWPSTCTAAQHLWIPPAG
jgi:hypothetical protein